MVEIKKEALVLPTDNPKHSIWYKTCGGKGLAIIAPKAIWEMFNFKEVSEI